MLHTPLTRLPRLALASAVVASLSLAACSGDAAVEPADPIDDIVGDWEQRDDAGTLLQSITFNRDLTVQRTLINQNGTFDFEGTFTADGEQFTWDITDLANGTQVQEELDYYANGVLTSLGVLYPEGINEGVVGTWSTATSFVQTEGDGTVSFNNQATIVFEVRDDLTATLTVSVNGGAPQANEGSLVDNGANEFTFTAGMIVITFEVLDGVALSGVNLTPVASFTGIHNPSATLTRVR